MEFAPTVLKWESFWVAFRPWMTYTKHTTDMVLPLQQGMVYTEEGMFLVVATICIWWKILKHISEFFWLHIWFKKLTVTKIIDKINLQVVGSVDFPGFSALDLDTGHDSINQIPASNGYWTGLVSKAANSKTPKSLQFIILMDTSLCLTKNITSHK